MGANIRLPNINAGTLSGQVSQIQSYLYQLAEQLNYELSNNDVIKNNVKILTVGDVAKEIPTQNAQKTFDSIKGLIIKSGDIVKAHYEKMDVLYLQGEYLTQSDFGTYAEATEVRIEATESSLTSTISSLETLSSDYGEYKRTSTTQISQNAENITLEAERATEAEATLSSSIEETAGSITAEVTRATAAEGTLSSRITETAESITAEVTRATGAEGTLSSRITETAGSITAEVTRATAAEGTLSSRITTEADKISLVVDSDKAIKAASITAAINAQTGSSKVLISADAIDINGITAFVRPGDLGPTGSTVIDGGRVTTGEIKSSNYAYSSGDYSTSGTMLSLTNGLIRSKNFTIKDDGTIKAKNAEISGSISASSITLNQTATTQVANAVDGLVRASRIYVKSGGKTIFDANYSKPGQVIMGGWNATENTLTRDNGKYRLQLSNRGITIDELAGGVIGGDDTDHVQITSDGLKCELLGTSPVGMDFLVNSLGVSISTMFDTDDYSAALEIHNNRDDSKHILVGGFGIGSRSESTYIDWEVTKNGYNYDYSATLVGNWNFPQLEALKERIAALEAKMN